MWEEKEVPSTISATEEEYRQLGVCSYSFLSNLDKLGYRAFSAESKSGEALDLGSFIDCYILTPDELDRRFVKMQKPYTGNKKTLVDYLVQNGNPLPVEAQEYLYETASSLGLWSTWSKERVLKELNQDFVYYVDSAIANRDKTTYSDEDLILAETCQNALIESPLTDHIFDEEAYGMESHFQVKGVFELDEVHLKFMIDILVADPINKKLYVYDLKTGSVPLDGFEANFIKYRYDIQYYIYTKGVEAIKESMGFGDYEVIPLQFIYLYKQAPEIPVIYQVPETLDVYNGYTTKYGYEITGVKQLLDDYKFYNGGYAVPRNVAEGHGIVILDI